MSSRHDQIAAFYASQAPSLLRAVRHAITGPDELIEDACSYAWTQLLTHQQVTLDTAGFGWLYVVARREAYRQSDRARREPAVGPPRDLQRGSEVLEDLQVVAERRERDRCHAELLRLLPERRRRMIVLHAAGFSYREIAALTGATQRTVERQLLRGKRALNGMHHTLTTSGEAR
jgi:RNA polymerase sigma factor (sigma-70 family)